MPPQGVVISEQAWGRVQAAVRWIERQAGGLELLPGGSSAAPNIVETFLARVTDGTPDADGHYTAQLTDLVDAEADAWEDRYEVLIRGANGEALTSGKRYSARPAVPTAAGDDLYVAYAGAGGISSSDYYTPTAAGITSTTNQSASGTKSVVDYSAAGSGYYGAVTQQPAVSSSLFSVTAAYPVDATFGGPGGNGFFCHAYSDNPGGFYSRVVRAGQVLERQVVPFAAFDRQDVSFLYDALNTRIIARGLAKTGTSGIEASDWTDYAVTLYAPKFGVFDPATRTTTDGGTAATGGLVFEGGLYKSGSISTGSGDVTGQASSVDGEVALFSGTGGKTIKRAAGTGLVSVSSGVYQTPANLSGDVSSSGYVTTIGAGKVTEAMQVLADNTTQNVSTTKHGYAPKLPNDATKYLDGTGAYTVPAGGGTGTVTSVALALPSSEIDVTGSPVATSGTLTGAWKTQAKNKLFAGPVSGADAAPTFRFADVLDLPAYAGLTATDVALDDELPEYDLSAAANRKVRVDRLLGFGDPSICNGRLTLTSATPVTITDVTGVTTIRFTPFRGNRIALYDGTRWRLYTFTELSLAIGGLSLANNRPHDVFIYDNSGTLTLELAEWSSDTARTTAITTQDGVEVKSGATNKRRLGAIRTDGSTQLRHTFAARFVWNLYNQTPQEMYAIESANSWTVTSTSWAAYNSASNARIEWLDGSVAGSESALVIEGRGQVETGAGDNGFVGIGLDTSSTNSGRVRLGGGQGLLPAISDYRGYPGIGYHYGQLLQRSQTGSGASFFGDNGGAGDMQAGILGRIWG